MINPRRTILNPLQDNQLPGASYTFIPRQSRVSGGRTEAAAEPSPTPTVTATPTPTPTPSSVPATPCEQIVVSAVPSGFEGYLGTYDLVITTPDLTEANDFTGSWAQDPSNTHVLYSATTGIIAYEQDGGNWFLYPTQSITGAVNSTGATGFAVGSGITRIDGKTYPDPANPSSEVVFSYPGGCV